MNIFFDSVAEFSSEYANLILISWLAYEIARLGISAIMRRYYIWWKEVVLFCALCLIVISMRELYYVGRIFFDFQRGTHGGNLVAIPSPVLWVSLALLMKRFRFLVDLFQRLEERLKRYEADYE